LRGFAPHASAQMTSPGPPLTLLCRPLTSRFEGWPDCEGPEQREEDDAQNHSQPGENEAKVVPDGAEDDVGGIAGVL
jgi:hypothetical protein